MNIEMSREDAIKLSETKFWETMTFRERAFFQFFQSRLCMPFDIFHEAMEKTLGRPVYTHEFASSNSMSMESELLGLKDAPSIAEIMNLIPKDKRIIIDIT